MMEIVLYIWRYIKYTSEVYDKYTSDVEHNKYDTELEKVKYHKIEITEKDLFRKFLLNLNYRLPLTDGYLRLIKCVFSEELKGGDLQDPLDESHVFYTVSDQIYRFLFPGPEPRFTFDETRVILENIKLNDIDLYSRYINGYEGRMSMDVEENKWLNLFFEIGDIDINNQNLTILDKNKYKFMIYHLLSIEITKMNKIYIFLL